MFEVFCRWGRGWKFLGVFQARHMKHAAKVAQTITNFGWDFKVREEHTVREEHFNFRDKCFVYAS